MSVITSLTAQWARKWSYLMIRTAMATKRTVRGKRKKYKLCFSKPDETERRKEWRCVGLL